MSTLKDIKGVYLIERINIDNNKVEPLYYVGKSVGVFNRWKQHCNGNEQHIDKTIKEIGYSNFAFSILEVVSKTKDLDNCETKWINNYKAKGECLMYNISQTNNVNPHLIDAKTKEEIKKLFESEIGRSIYAIAEKYKISFNNVIEIRKPLLKKQGLKYDMRLKNIVNTDGKHPENWKGNHITKNMYDKILELRRQEIDNDDISYECNISTTDLKIFFNEYEKMKDKYHFSETLI